MRFTHGHLAYCTNIHPAETWESTLSALSRHTLKVRDLVTGNKTTPFAIGLRLSRRAATELLQGSHLPAFRDWLAEENAYVFTINGFPYGSFHGTSVKRDVFRPDWTTRERLDYTLDLFHILSVIAPTDVDASVSTLPGSFKEFHADENLIRQHLLELASAIEDLSQSTGRDFHLGLEPEPRGHFENTPETLAFFERLLSQAPDPELVKRRIGINYDCCHLALQYETAQTSLETLVHAGLRISKIHLSAALALDPRQPGAREDVARFDEPTYLHQVLARNHDGTIDRYTDLPLALAEENPSHEEWRIHFHIPLDTLPASPLRSTRDHAAAALAYAAGHPDLCSHWEIETYTWGVLPQEWQRPVEEQIAAEYRWTLAHTTHPSP